MSESESFTKELPLLLQFLMLAFVFFDSFYEKTFNFAELSDLGINLAATIAWD